MPPISFILVNKSRWLFSFLIVNDWVVEPVLVNTVSYFSVSALVFTTAFGEVMNESFLQEEKQKAKNKQYKKQYFGFNNFMFQK
jgi:phosphate/sulfate permease